MRETKITVIYIIIATAFVALALFTTPDEIASKAFNDQGGEFFPEFKSVDDCTKINTAQNNISKTDSLDFICGDALEIDLPKSDAFIILDVLHYLPKEKQNF